jgi:putative tryptophan/tyrosine transport system substrate-binding protein
MFLRHRRRSGCSSRPRRKLSATSASLGLKLNVVHARSEGDLAAIFESLVQLKTEALVIGSDAFFSSRGELLGRLAFRHHLPAIYQYPEFTAAGGLISYGGNVAESYLLVGIYVGRILKGERPANLAVQEVTKVELIINLEPISKLRRAVDPL